MRTLEELLAKAVPRLEAGDSKARKLQAKLTKLGAYQWSKGRSRLKRLGLEIERDAYAPIEAEGEAFLEEARELLGDKNFVRFMRVVKKELSRKLAEKKAREEGGDEPEPKRESSRKRRSSREGRSSKTSSKSKSSRRKSRSARPAKVEEEPLELEPEEAPLMQISDAGRISDAGLVLPDDDDELAIPDELALPDDDELELPDELGMDPPSATEYPVEVEVVEELNLDDDDDDDDDDIELDLGLEIKIKGDAEEAAGSSGDGSGEQALASYLKGGDPAQLKAAKTAFKAALKSADGPAQAAARGGLARVYLCEGAVDKAEDAAKKALKAVPSERNAVATLCELDLPEAVKRHRCQALVAQASEAFYKGEEEVVTKAAAKLQKTLPKEPFGALILLAAALEKGGDAIEPALKRAWKAYPASEGYADLQLGESLINGLVPGLLRWLQKQVDEDEQALGKTVKDVEGKSNLYAGAWQIALGEARLANALRKHKGEEKQRVVYWIGLGLFGAQYYDTAKKVFIAAKAFDRESDLISDLQGGETQCGVMWRAHDRPGVKAKKGKVEGVGAVAARAGLEARLAEVEGLQGDRERFESKQTQLIDGILADSKRRKAIAKRAEGSGKNDPFVPYEAIISTLEPAPAKKEKPKKKGGFLGRMKAGLNDAIDKAKTAGKQDEGAEMRRQALSFLVEALLESPKGGWKDKELDAFVAKAASVLPRMAYLEGLAKGYRKALGKVSEF